MIIIIILISNYRRVLNVVCFLLGDSTGVCSLNANVSEQTEFSEALAFKLQTPLNHTE
jgi:hypothetical protein